MTETYLWQGVPNQGYNKYGKGVVGPGSKESLNGAVNFHAGAPVGTKYPVTDKSLITKIEVLNKPTKIPNRWGEKGTDYKMNRGELRMTYGMRDIEYMDDRWKLPAQAKGKTKLLDQAGSIEPSLMEVTHRDAQTGEYLIGKFKQRGAKFNAVKDANIGVTIPTEGMTHVLTSEAAKKGAEAVKLKPGMVIAHDALGVYTPPLATVLKKNQPVTDLGEVMAHQLKRFQKIQDTAAKYVKEGHITQANADKYIENAWKSVTKLGNKVQKLNRIEANAAEYASKGLISKANAGKYVAKAMQPISTLAQKIKKFNRIQALATKYAKDGAIPKEHAQKYIAKAWNIVKHWAKKARV